MTALFRTITRAVRRISHFPPIFILCKTTLLHSLALLEVRRSSLISINDVLHAHLDLTQNARDLMPPDDSLVVSALCASLPSLWNSARKRKTFACEWCLSEFTHSKNLMRRRNRSKWVFFTPEYFGALMAFSADDATKQFTSGRDWSLATLHLLALQMSKSLNHWHREHLNRNITFQTRCRHDYLVFKAVCWFLISSLTSWRENVGCAAIAIHHMVEIFRPQSRNINAGAARWEIRGSTRRIIRIHPLGTMKKKSTPSIFSVPISPI